MSTKAGFVTIIGKPNAGKSSLMNALIETKLSIVTPKPQTTRKEIVGILSTNDYQIVFLDTPGHIKPKYKLQEVMMEYLPNSIIAADIILAVFDYDNFTKTHKLPLNDIEKLVKNYEVPKIAVLNKIDIAKHKSHVIPILEELSNSKLFDEIIPLSATNSINLQELENTIVKYLPVSQFYYGEDSLSTLNSKFFAAEIIREKIFLNLEEEIPYSTEVQIQEFIEREKGKWFILADIVVEKNTQKQILIGKNGSMIKKISSESRLEIEKLLEYPVYLELFVKVRKDWRDNPKMIKSFGY